MKPAPRGMALLDVLLAMGIVTAFAVAQAQMHVNAFRLQRAATQRLTAMVLLDAWAEYRQMTGAASAPRTPGAPLPGVDGAGTAARSLPDLSASMRLSHARFEAFPAGDGVLALAVRWRQSGPDRRPSAPRRDRMPSGLAATSACDAEADGWQCELIVVPAFDVPGSAAARIGPMMIDDRGGVMGGRAR